MVRCMVGLRKGGKWRFEMVSGAKRSKGHEGWIRGGHVEGEFKENPSP